jgi:hypothetical protein
LPDHPVNGDETSLAAYIGSFTKGLPHTQLGEVQPGTYETLLHALATGSQADFENLDRGSGSKFINPLAAYAFQMEGADSHNLAIDPPPAFTSAAAAGEMVDFTGRQSRATSLSPITPHRRLPWLPWRI